jgi:putative ABC transport system permease protein
MWRNYVTVGIRALLKNKTYAFINIFGLGIGLAACLMLLLYVRYERSYDEWLPGAENIYQVQAHFQNPDTGEENDFQQSPYVSGPALRKDFPQIESSVYALLTTPIVMRDGEPLSTQDVFFVNDLFFDTIPLPLVQGDPRTALLSPGSVVLSETEARRYFGDANPMGQTVTMISRGNSIDARVTGVMRDLPRNSHMRTTMIVRFDPISYFGVEAEDFMSQWGWNSGWNYVRLRDGTDVNAINSSMPAWEERNIPDQTIGDQTTNQGDFADWRLTNVRDIHLGPAAHNGGMSPGNDERTILTFTIIAFLILGMACVNFTNLATARASQRAREVALRKVLGASRKQLMTQFLMESVLLAGMAMLLALALVELTLPALSNFLDADLRMSYFGEGSMLLPIVLLTVLVGAAGGVYPAFYLSRFQPAQVLKANKSTAEAGGSGRLRSILVVSQFAVSIGLIICTGVVYAQTVYARNVDPGFRREGIFQIDVNRRQISDRIETLQREIGRVPGVVSIGRTGIGIDPINQNGTGVAVPGRDQPVNVGNYTMDDNFFRIIGVEFVAGRDLTENRPMDVDPRAQSATPDEDRALVARGLNVVANTLATERLGFRTPQEAVGAQLHMSIADEEAGPVPITIVGVVSDTRFRSIREPLEPIIFRVADYGATNLVVRYEGSPTEIRERVQQAWHRIAPDAPMEADFSENIVAELYEAEQARAQLFAGFALLAVIVACLGLFGLAAFTAERRTKEIGIRKVLGARTRDIVRLLAWQFSKPVIIANLIAWPIAWWAMRDWLNTFDARIDLGPTPFVIAGLLALAIAIGTIAGHAFKVARANPIHALRYE